MPGIRKRTDAQIAQMVLRHVNLRNAKIGETLPCPSCEQPLFKGHGQTTFCTKQCRDFYWKQVKHLDKRDPFPPPQHQSAFIGYM